jgi:hypothetical protein
MQSARGGKVSTVRPRPLLTPLIASGMDLGVVRERIQHARPCAMGLILTLEAYSDCSHKLRNGDSLSLTESEQGGARVEFTGVERVD